MSETFYAILSRRKELLQDELEKIDYLLSSLPDSRRRIESKNSQIIQIAKEMLLQDNSYPIPTGNIMRKVIAEGIALGTNSAQNLSAILSKAEEFKNMRGKGWILMDTPIHRELLEEEYEDIMPQDVDFPELMEGAV